MFHTHKIELRPTPEQAEYFAQCAGCMRYVYNQLVDKVVNKKDLLNYQPSLTIRERRKTDEVEIVRPAVSLPKAILPDVVNSNKQLTRGVLNNATC